MIIMDPYQIPWLIARHNGLAEDSVRLDVCFPARRSEFQLGWEVVKNGPEGLVCIALIESCGNVGGQFNCEASLCVRPVLKNCPALFAIVLLAVTRPANPIPTTSLQQRFHGAGQPSRASFGNPVSIGQPDGEGETVRYDNKPITHTSDPPRAHHRVIARSYVSSMQDWRKSRNGEFGIPRLPDSESTRILGWSTPTELLRRS